MKNFRVLGVLISIMLIVIMIGCSPKQTLDKRILGQWKLAEEDGKVYFSSDGKMYVRAEKSIDITYSILNIDESSRTLKMKVIDPDDNSEMIWNWTFSEDYKTLTLTAEREGTEVFVFIDKAQKP